MTAPVSVCMIVRDEEHQLPSCLKALRPFVQEIVIVDTGSEDGTLDLANRHADIVKIFTDCNDPQGRMLRFDLARNYSLSLATQPWVMWVDADDEVGCAENLGALIKRYDAERRGGPAMIMMPYEYSHDAQGRVDLLLERERLVTPKEHFEWHGWVHEVLAPKGADMRRSTGAMKVVHRRSKSKKKSEPGRNLRILEAQYAAEGDADARHLYYLGQELGYAGRIDEAISFLTKHIDRSDWDDERYMSAQLVAGHLINRCEYEKAIEWAMKAILIREDWAEAYFTVAKCAYFIAKETNQLRWWQRSAHFARVGLDKPRTSTPLFVNPLERDFEIHKYLNMALSKIGDTKGALASVGKALSVRPDDEHLLFNKRVYEEYDAVEGFKQSLNRLVVVGKITREVRQHLQAVQEKNAVPNEIRRETHENDANGVAPRPAPRKTLPPFDPRHLDVVLYVGYSVEGWNPETFKESGLGGSETAVVEMGKRLAALGHRIRVFGDCFPHNFQGTPAPSLEGSFDGVEYLHYEKFRDVQCDVLVSSRRPEAVDAPGLETRRAILWVHDVHCGDQLTPERAGKFDLIWTLSEWHRRFFVSKYPFLQAAGDKVKVTRNGIDLRRFDKVVPRDGRRVIYSSSPDRGLQAALETWPEIRARVPGAELHVFYGFNNWEPFADEGQRKVIAHLKKLLAETEGVRFHGRKAQDFLAEEFLKSGVWAYPTWFHETSCITAMEAQAAGLRIVTSPIGALNETVGPRGILIPGNWLSASYKSKFVDAVVGAMLKDGDEDRRALQHYAREHFGWDDLAKEWESTFRTFLPGEAVPPAASPAIEQRQPRSGVERIRSVNSSSIVHCVLTEYASGDLLMDVRNPLSENTGGGCRAAFLGLVKQLPKYGHTVRAFSTFKESMVLDGVEYLPLSELHNRGRPNVMWALYDTRPLGTQAGVFRIGSHHTYHVIAPFTHIDVNTIPCQAALDQVKPFFAPWSIWEVLPNAINPVPDWKPVEGRVVYHTSPDRGLHKLAEIWPEIKARVSGATLHVVGRVDDWIAGHLGGHGSENSESAKRARALKQNLAKAREAGGVEFFRNLPRTELLEQLSQASVFAFPCTVLLPCETFSASAMECCKIGVPVVMTPQDALESIYKGHVLMVPPPIEKNLGMFADAVVQVLVDPIVRERYSRLGRELAKDYTYERSGRILNRIICEHTGFASRIPIEGSETRSPVEADGAVIHGG